MPANNVVKEIRRATRRKFSTEEKIRIFLEGLRGAVPITELCRREGIAVTLCYRWSKVFLKVGQNCLILDTRRDASKEEVKQLKQENDYLDVLKGHRIRFTEMFPEAWAGMVG